METEVNQERREALANYLNNIREHRSLGHNQLAVLSGVEKSALHKILHGTVKKVNPFHLQAIAKALKLDYKILYQLVGYLENASDDEDTLTPIELNQEIPVYSKVHAGPDGNLEYGEILEYITIPRLRNGTKVIGAKVDGNSMEPTIPNGATVLVKLDVEINHNDVGIFVLNNNPLVKRYKHKNGFTMLLSDNREYDPIIVSEGDEFFIVGKVVEVMYKL